MIKIKKVMQSLIAAAALLGMTALPVSAADNYTYTVTFYAGNQGTFASASGLTVAGQGNVSIQNTGDRITVSGLQTGDTVSFDIQQGAVRPGDDSRYYVQGVRPSARDNDTASLAPSAFRVTEDADYVVAYGIQGDQVAYTVNYEDEEGNTLAPSQTYYGNVGDKPVVAYLYIENYLPEALALTKTLSADASENVFTFVYQDASPEVITEPGDIVTITTVIPGTNTVQTIQVPAQAAGVAGAAGAGAGTTAGGAGTAGGTGTAGTAGTTGGTGTTAGGAGTAGTDAQAQGGTQEAGENADGQGETINPDETPQGVVDLDEDETPTGDGSDVVEETGKDGLPLAAGIGIGVAGLAALCVILALIRKFRR